MAIHAQTSCTLSTITDVEAVYTYYYLSDSTITVDEAPKDGVNAPGAQTITVISDGESYIWQLTEPELDIEDDVIQTAVGKLYYIECVKFSNGTYDWGPLMTSSTYAAAKAAYNLSYQAIGQAQSANRATALLGGHYIYNSEWQTSNTPHSANVVQTVTSNGIDVSDDPTKWEYNTHIGANGIRLRYNEIILSEWKTNSLIFYIPTQKNNNLVQGEKGLEITASGIDLYNPTVSYKEYEGTIGNPRELRLYEYSSLDNTYILTQDTTFLSNKTYYKHDIVKGLEITAEGIDLYNPNGNKGLEITSNGIDIFGENETKGLSMQSGGLVIYDPSETSSALIAVQQTGFRLGYDADTLEGLDPYTTAIAEPFIVWQKAEDNEQDAHNRLYIYTDDIILRINDNSPSTQQLFLKDKLSQIDDNILANNQAINTNKQKIQKNENEISVNTQNIILNKENISKNTTDITLINNKLIKIKAYWTIDNNNHLTLVEGVLNG